MKIQNLFFFFAFSLFSSFGLAQNFNWKWIDNPYSFDPSTAIAVSKTLDSSAVIFGGRADEIYSNSEDDGYIRKLTKAGVYQWYATVSSSGNGDDEVSAIDVDALGNVYFAGTFTSNAEIEGQEISGTHTLTGGNTDIFIVKLTSSGQFVWAVRGTGSQKEYIKDLKYHNGSLYIVGNSQSNFAFDGTTFSNQGDSDAFLLKLSAADGSLTWLKGAGSNDDDSYNSLAILGGEVFVGGSFSGSTFSFLGSGITPIANTDTGKTEGILAKYSTSNGAVLGHAIISGTGNATMERLVSKNNKLYYTGSFSKNPNFPGFAAISQSNTELFVGRCGTSLLTTDWLKYTTSTSGGNGASGTSIDIDSSGNLFVCGNFKGTSNFSAHNFTSNGDQDILILKLDPENGNYITGNSYGGSSEDNINDLSISDVNRIYFAGSYRNSVNFSPIPKTAGSQDTRLHGAFGCIPGTATLSGTSSLCQGDSVALTFNFTGGTSYNVKYTDGTSIFELTGITTSSHTVYVSPSSTKTYEIVSFFANSCVSTFSGTAVITVVGPVSGNTIISAPSKVCSGSAPDSLVGSTPTGGLGSTYTYIWQSKLASSAVWNTASGVYNGKNYSPPALTATYVFRRGVISGPCDTSFTTNDTIFVHNPVSNNLFSDTYQTICSISNADTIVGGILSGGTGVLTYQWLKKTDASPAWVAAGGTYGDSANYVPGNLSETTYFRRIVLGPVCNNDTSNIHTITVDQEITNNFISGSNTRCSTQEPLLDGSLPNGGNGLFSYLWQVSADNVNFSNTLPNVTTEDYNLSNLSVVYYYRRKVTSGACASTYSDTVVVDALVTNNTISANQTICSSDSPDLLTGPQATTHVIPTLYTWQQSTNGISWTNADLINNTLNYLPPMLDTSMYYRRIVNTPGCGDTTSNTILVTVQKPIENNSISSSQTICNTNLPNTLNGTLPTEGSGTYNYFWESRTLQNATWSSAVGSSNSQNYSPNYLSETTLFRRKVVAGVCDSTFSNVDTIFVENPITNNLILTTNQTICNGTIPDTIFGTTENGGPGVGSYIWQIKNNDNPSWTTHSTGTDTFLNLGALTQTTDIRRLIASSLCDTSISNIVSVFVQNPISSNAILTPTQNNCSTNPADTIFALNYSGGNSSNTIIWQTKMNPNSWVNVASNYTDTSLILGTLNQTIFIRRIILDNICANDTSNVDSVIVHNPVSQNTILSDTNLCASTTSFLVTGSSAVNGFGYTWQKTSDTTMISNWTVQSGFVGQDYIISNPVDTFYYRRVIEGGNCPDDFSNIVEVIKMTPISNNWIDGDTTICYGETFIPMVGSSVIGGSGSTILTWENSMDGSTYTAITTNGNGPNYEVDTAYHTLYFRRRAVNELCPSEDSTSNVLLMTVNELSTGVFNGVKDSVCSGMELDLPLTLSGANPYNVYYTWNGGSNIFSGISNDNFIHTYIPQTSDTFHLDSIQDANGCVYSLSDDFTVKWVEQPVTNLFNDTVICDSSYNFLPNLSTGVIDFSSTPIIALTQSFPQPIVVDDFGLYTFVLKETNEFCNDADTMSIEFFRPISNVSAGEDMEFGGAIQVQLNATYLIGNEQGEWTTITGSGIFDNVNSATPIITEISSEDNYYVWTVKNGVCPIVRDTIFVKVIPLNIPSGFSPNGDGANDKLVIEGTIEYNYLKLKIFNRWGNLIFSSDDYKNDWDGTAKNGEQLPEDTYYMIVDLEDKEMYKGYLILKR